MQIEKQSRQGQRRMAGTAEGMKEVEEEGNKGGHHSRF